MLEVYKFVSDSCGPCKILSPIIEELERKYPYVKFITINVATTDEDEQEKISKVNVRSVPVIAFFKDGKDEPEESLIGFQDKITIENRINKLK